MSTERKILFRLEANPSAKGKDDALTLQAYDDCGWCQDLYVGDMGRCGSLLFNGTFGGITKDDFVDVNTACVSHFFDKDAKPLVAMITPAWSPGRMVRSMMPAWMVLNRPYSSSGTS